MYIKTFIDDWLTASNEFDTKKYLAFYHFDAILDDPTVGRKFMGHAGIKEYFDSYFTGYNTHTKLVTLKISDENKAYITVQFRGDFPEGKVDGSFDFRFKKGKIAHVEANLIH